MRVGLVLDGRRSASEIAELAALAEAHRFSHVWLSGGEVNYSGAHYRVKGLFSPWSRVPMDGLYLGANRPRMLRLAAQKADGVMVTDMPTGYLGSLIARVRAELAEAGRDPRAFALS